MAKFLAFLLVLFCVREAGAATGSINITSSPPSANQVVLLNNKFQKMDVAGVGNFGIFQGAMPNRTDVLIANLSTTNGGTTNSTNATFAMSTGCANSGTTAADNTKFKIVTTANQWVVDSRPGPWIVTNGAQNVQPNGFRICVAGTDGSGTFPTPITIGDVPYNPGSKTPITVSGCNIQTAISTANSSTQYVYVPGGSNCSGTSFNGANGVDVVTSTTQNHINGGTSRASVGQINPANNSIYYGFSTNSGWNMNGTSGVQFINNFMDLGGGTGEYYIFNNDTNLHLAWNTFQNGNGGNDQNGDGENGLLNEHNVWFNTAHDSDASDLCNSNNIEYNADFLSDSGTQHNPNGLSGAGGVEFQGAGGCSTRGTVLLRDMYCIRNNNGNGAFCYSFVGGFGSLSFLYGYAEDDPRATNPGCPNGGGGALEIGNDPQGPFRVYQTAFNNTGGGSSCGNLSVWGCYGPGPATTDNDYLVYNNSCGSNTNQHTFSVVPPPWAAGAN